MQSTFNLIATEIGCELIIMHGSNNQEETKEGRKEAGKEASRLDNQLLLVLGGVE